MTDPKPPNPLGDKDFVKICGIYEYLKGNAFQRALDNLIEAGANSNFDHTKVKDFLTMENVKKWKTARKEVNKLIKKVKKYPWSKLRHLEAVDIPKLLHLEYLHRTGYFQHEGMKDIHFPIENLRVSIGESRIRIFVETLDTNFIIQYVFFSSQTCVWIGETSKVMREPPEELAASDLVSLIRHSKTGLNELEFGVDSEVTDIKGLLSKSEFYFCVEKQLENIKVKRLSLRVAYSSHVYHWLRFLEPGTLEDIKIRVDTDDNHSQFLETRQFREAMNLDIQDPNIFIRDWSAMQNYSRIYKWHLDFQDLRDLDKLPLR
uniref:FTH domain-containing protein n=1 Tax=Caenorhabditis tropicalis TaxID=1561998 RepID=A0A1I7UV54_9PELO